jgi:hypothetical protein
MAGVAGALHRRRGRRGRRRRRRRGHHGLSTRRAMSEHNATLVVVGMSGTERIRIMGYFRVECVSWRVWSTGVLIRTVW